jgi:conjugal transfer/entry exclusion protein
MRKVIFAGLLVACFSQSALSQGIDPRNPNSYFIWVKLKESLEQTTQIVSNTTDQLNELARLKKVVEHGRQTLQFARDSYQRQLENIRSLPEKDWNNFNDLHQNIRQLEANLQGMESINSMLDYKYVTIYDEFERQKAHWQGMHDKIRKLEREEALNDNAKRLAVATQNQENIDKHYQDLEAIEQDFISNPSAKAVAESQVKVNAILAQNMIELRRIMSLSLELAAKEDIRKAAAQEAARRDNEEFFKQWKESIDEDEKKLNRNPFRRFPTWWGQ